MKRIISAKAAGITLLVIFGVLIVFHLLVLFQALPATIVWGGQAGASSSGLLVLELASLLFTVIFAVVVAARIGLIGRGKLAKLVNILLWVIFAYLVLNTLGNLASSSPLEKAVFTPITVIAALLVLRLAIER